jgi:hypothetical protein
MKKVLMVTMITLTSFIGFGQNIPIYNGEYFYTTLENGVGVEQKLKFTLSKDDYEKIKNSDLFKQWKQITWSNPKNEGYIQHHKGWDEVLMYLNGEITSCKFTLKFIKLKNGNSLKFIEGSKGMIYLSDDGGIRISFPFESQNGYGNNIVGKTIYSIDMKNGKEETECYVYSN